MGITKWTLFQICENELARATEEYRVCRDGYTAERMNDLKKLYKELGISVGADAAFASMDAAELAISHPNPKSEDAQNLIEVCFKLADKAREEGWQGDLPGNQITEN